MTTLIITFNVVAVILSVMYIRLERQEGSKGSFRSRLTKKRRFVLIAGSVTVLGLVVFAGYQYIEKQKYMNHLSNEFMFSFLLTGDTLENINRSIDDYAEQDQWTQSDRRDLLQQYEALGLSWTKILAISTTEQPDIFEGMNQNLYQLTNSPEAFLNEAVEEEVEWSNDVEDQLNQFKEINEVLLSGMVENVYEIDQNFSGHVSLNLQEEDIQPFIKRKSWMRFFERLEAEQLLASSES
ncbi:hypothetical protein LCM20_01565 [Halobacillus litoralis]|uniref:hypothetical protein n=1 Tax=Halobacillus litoralis TaxID=45668 RepID=UPI001CD49CA1|nr:hypothetical protein [Halobacillus litoralis]MCA0969274.1 hypothetical protein [Halobacillus litoralis]